MAKTPDSREVYHWPEFKALCARLGIPWEAATCNMTITLEQDKTVMVTHVYRGRDNTPVDTTTVHNKQWRTKQPPSPEVIDLHTALPEEPSAEK